MAHKDKARLPRGEATRLIMAEIEGGNTTVAAIADALSQKNIKISRPLIYRVLRGRKGDDTAFTVNELLKARQFVADIGSVERAMRVLNAYRELESK